MKRKSSTHAFTCNKEKKAKAYKIVTDPRTAPPILGRHVVWSDQKGNEALAIGADTWWTQEAITLSHIKARLLRREGFQLMHRPPIKIFGKVAHQNRDVGFFSDAKIEGYRFSGQVAKTSPMTEDMRVLTQAVNTYLGTQFNAVLINYYADGADSIGAHGDNETQLSGYQVAGVCFGVTRTLRLRDKQTKAQLHDHHWVSDSLFVMSGQTFQKDYTHEIPVSKKIKGARISLTWRLHATLAKHAE